MNFLDETLVGFVPFYGESLVNFYNVMRKPKIFSNTTFDWRKVRNLVSVDKGDPGGLILDGLSRV